LAGWNLNAALAPSDVSFYSVGTEEGRAFHGPVMTVALLLS